MSLQSRATASQNEVDRLHRRRSAQVSWPRRRNGESYSSATTTSPASRLHGEDLYLLTHEDALALQGAADQRGASTWRTPTSWSRPAGRSSIEIAGRPGRPLVRSPQRRRSASSTGVAYTTDAKPELVALPRRRLPRDRVSDLRVPGVIVSDRLVDARLRLLRVGASEGTIRRHRPADGRRRSARPTKSSPRRCG